MHTHYYTYTRRKRELCYLNTAALKYLLCIYIFDASNYDSSATTKCVCMKVECINKKYKFHPLKSVMMRLVDLITLTRCRRRSRNNSHVDF